MDELYHDLCKDVYCGRIDSVRKNIACGDNSLPFLLACREGRDKILQLITSRGFLPQSCVEYGVTICPKQSMTRTICEEMLSSFSQTSTKSIVDDLKEYARNKEMRRVAAFKAGLHILAPRLVKEGVLAPNEAREFLDFTPRLGVVVPLAGMMDIPLSLVEVSDVLFKGGFVYAARKFAKVFPSRVPKVFLGEFQNFLVKRFRLRGGNDIMGASLWLSNLQGKPLWYGRGYEFWFAAAFHFALYNQLMTREDFVGIKNANISTEALDHIMMIQVAQLSAKVTHPKWLKLRVSLYAQNYTLFIELFKEFLESGVHNVATNMYKALIDRKIFPHGNMPHPYSIIRTAIENKNGPLSAYIISIQNFNVPIPGTMFGGIVKELFDMALEYEVDIVILSLVKRNLIPQHKLTRAIPALIHLHENRLLRELFPNRTYTDGDYRDALRSKNTELVNIIGFETHSFSAWTMTAMCTYGNIELMKRYIEAAKHKGNFSDLDHDNGATEYLSAAVTGGNVRVLEFIHRNFTFRHGGSGDRNVILFNAVKFPNKEIIKILADIHRESGYLYFNVVPRYSAYKPLTKEKVEAYFYIYEHILGDPSRYASSYIRDHIISFIVGESSKHSRRIIQFHSQRSPQFLGWVIQHLFLKKVQNPNFLGNLHNFPSLFAKIPLLVRLKSVVIQSLTATPTEIDSLKTYLQTPKLFDNSNITLFKLFGVHTRYSDIPIPIRTLLLEKLESAQRIDMLLYLIRNGDHRDINTYFSLPLINVSSVDEDSRIMRLILRKKDTHTLSKLINHPTSDIYSILFACLLSKKVNMFTFVIETERGGNYIKTKPRYIFLDSISLRNFTIQSLILSKMTLKHTENTMVYTLYSLLFDSHLFIQKAMKYIPDFTWHASLSALNMKLYNSLLYLAISTGSHENVRYLLFNEKVRKFVNINVVIEYLSDVTKRNELINGVFNKVLRPVVGNSIQNDREFFDKYRAKLPITLITQKLKFIMYTFLRRRFFDIENMALIYMKNFFMDPSKHHLFETVYEFITVNQTVNFDRIKNKTEIKRLYAEYTHKKSRDEEVMDVDT